jgi:hypothetical protein
MTSCSWVLYAEDGTEVEHCEREAVADLEFAGVETESGNRLAVPFCAFHAAIVDGVVL